MHQARPAPAPPGRAWPATPHPACRSWAGRGRSWACLAPSSQQARALRLPAGKRAASISAGGLHRHQLNALAGQPVDQSSSPRTNVAYSQTSWRRRPGSSCGTRHTPSQWPCRCPARRPAPPTPPALRSAPHRSPCLGGQRHGCPGSQRDGQEPGSRARGDNQGPPRRLQASDSLRP
jgi:hypothetical protein